MSFNLLQTVDDLSQSLISTLKRFPLASFSAFLMTIILISLIELDYHDQNNSMVILANKVAFVSSLAIILFPALHLLKRHFLMMLFGLGLIAGYYFILPINIAEAHSSIFFRHTLLILALFLMLIWAPFINVKISNKNIWEWTQNLILALLATVVFSLILYAGFSGALYAIDKLFELNIEHRRYVQLGVLIFGLYGVNFFLAQIPKYILLLQVRTYSNIETIFTKYILSSLALGYFLILFSYNAKILILMEWPKGILAWLSLLFAMIAISTYFFWTPLWKSENIKFKRLLWGAILLQTFMLGMAIWMRIDAYGVTESRYFIALFGIWLLIMSLYFILIKDASYKWFFVTLSLLLVGSQFGKYSASEISRTQQSIRLQKMITEATPLSEALEIRTKYEISDVIVYLYQHYGTESLQTIAPEIIKEYEALSTDRNSTTYFPNFVTKKLGFKLINRWEWQDYINTTPQQNRGIVFNSTKEKNTFKVEGYQWITNFYYNKKSKIEAKIISNESNLTLKFKDNRFYVIEHNRYLADINLNKFIVSVKNEPHGNIYYRYRVIDSKKMEYDYNNTKVSVKLFINSFILLDDGNITDFSCKVLLGRETPPSIKN